MKQHVLIPQFIESAPPELSEGVLYISERYRTALHKCCCGCGTKVVTPLNAAGWWYTVYRDKVTLRPSIGNWSFPCRSHYFITLNQVVWAGSMTARQIKSVKSRDLRDQGEMIAKQNKEKLAAGQVEASEVQNSSPSRISRWWSAARRWLKT